MLEVIKFKFGPAECLAIRLAILFITSSGIQTIRPIESFSIPSSENSYCLSFYVLPDQHRNGIIFTHANDFAADLL